jgi:dienelactone hydrolase
MVQDVVAAVAFLEARGYARGHIGLMGASVGCSVALAAAVDDPGLAGVVALTPGTRYLGQDSAAEIAAWDGRPLLLVSSHDEAGGGARPLHDALLARDPWSSADLVLLDHSSIHGTHMFGTVDGVESRLADWWAGVLAE